MALPTFIESSFSTKVEYEAWRASQTTDVGAPASPPAAPAAAVAGAGKDASADASADAARLVSCLREDGCVATRWHRLRSYAKCFTGAAAVALAVRRGFAADAPSAVTLLRRLLFASGLAHHVTDEHDLDDAHLFYRLLEDEPAAKRAAFLPAGPLLASLGDFGDVAHDAAALERATASATGPRGAFHGPVSVKGFLGLGWTTAHAAIGDGRLRLYKCAAAASPLVSLKIAACDGSIAAGTVSEIGATCNPGSYCMRLEGKCEVSGKLPSLLFCVGSSKEQLVWLQALGANGLEYRELEAPPSTTSLHELSALKLGAGKDDGPFEMREHAGRVLLVVNVASK